MASRGVGASRYCLSQSVVVTGSGDGRVRIWDLATRVPIGTPLTGHNGPIRAVTAAEAGDGTDIITGGQGATVRIWDLATHAPIGKPITGHTGPVRAVTTAQLRDRT